MAKVTRIKASDGPRKDDSADDTVVRKRVSVKDKKSDKAKRKARREAEKQISADFSGVSKAKTAKLNKKVVQNGSSKTGAKQKGEKKPFVLFRPFVALGHYLRDSWRELRQVRWPNRKATWQMLIAVLLYSALFMVMITLLDLFFSWLFNIMLSK